MYHPIVVSRSTRKGGFTLVELLVVIAIIGILIALLLPAVQAAREAARRAQCSSNMKQVALALLNYESNHKVLPPGRMGCDNNPRCPAVAQRVGTSAFVCILPFMEEQAVYDMFDFEDGPWGYSSTWYVGSGGEAIGQRIASYICPSDNSNEFADTSKVGPTAYDIGSRKAAVGNFALCAGTAGPGPDIDGKSVDYKYDNDGVFYYSKAHKLRDISDGTSTTFFVGEVIEAHTRETIRGLVCRITHRLTGFPTTARSRADIPVGLSSATGTDMWRLSTRTSISTPTARCRLELEARSSRTKNNFSRGSATPFVLAG